MAERKAVRLVLPVSTWNTLDHAAYEAHTTVAGLLEGAALGAVARYADARLPRPVKRLEPYSTRFVSLSLDGAAFGEILHRAGDCGGLAETWERIVEDAFALWMTPWGHREAA